MNAERAPQGGAHDTPGDAAAGERSEEELRAAYEEELNRITSEELMLQAAVSLLNLGGRRLGPPPGAASEGGAPTGPRDLEQVRDAIDGVRALLGVLERRRSGELGPLRDALSQLQLAYAREAQAGASAPSAGGEQATGAAAGEQPPEQAAQEGGTGAAPDEQSSGPGPAEASGRLWVPGR
jgi:hypothetical protein